MVLFTLMVLVARFVFPYIWFEINYSNIITAINGSFIVCYGSLLFSFSSRQKYVYPLKQMATPN